MIYGALIKTIWQGGKVACRSFLNHPASLRMNGLKINVQYQRPLICPIKPFSSGCFLVSSKTFARKLHPRLSTQLEVVRMGCRLPSRPETAAADWVVSLRIWMRRTTGKLRSHRLHGAHYIRVPGNPTIDMAKDSSAMVVLHKKGT